MKIIIVDDEVFVRVSFKSFIDWEKYGFELVGEASDGDAALELIDEMNPDVVFLDIKMPKLDGIGVLRILKEKKSVTRVIVLSGYNDFEYVREAMKLGAVDYIHKPSMDTENIIEALNNAKADLENQKRLLDEYDIIRKDIENSKPNLKSLFLKEFIDGGIRMKWEIEQRMRSLDIKLGSINVVCMVISIDNYKLVQDRYKNNKKHLLDFALKNIIDELFRDEKEIEFFKYHDNVYTLIKTYSRVRSMSDIHSNCDLITRMVKDALKQFLNIGITIGICKLQSSLMDLPLAFNQALAANKFKFFNGEGKVIYYHSLNSGDINSEGSNMEIKKILQFIKENLAVNDFEKVRKCLEKVYSNTEDGISALYRDETEVKNLSMMIYYLLNEKHNEIYSKDSVYNLRMVSFEDIVSAESSSCIKGMFLKALDNLCVLVNEGSKMNIKNSKIKKAIEFIDLNLKRDISLEEASELIELNSSYFSRLFKDETGMTFINYVNKRRIDMAAGYIKNTDMKNYEIAELVGYNNVEYFNIMFKKLTGKTPSEYRHKSDN